MTIHVHLINETPVKLWCLSARQRLQRMLEREGTEATMAFSEDLTRIPEQDSVLLLRGDYLYDKRIIAKLVATESVALRAAADEPFVAAHVPMAQALQARDLLNGTAHPKTLPHIRLENPVTLDCGYDAKLRKFEPPLLRPITAENRAELERRLFDGAYKGITDLVTKWVWPLPARWATSFCAHLGIRPNHVTSLSWVLAILSGFLFAYGYYGWGLASGWLMTFLDTVDGKLARVTVNYTNFGNLFDHLLDLIHPPLWYLAWGLGLSTFSPGISALTVSTTVWLIFIGYLVGRLLEGAFHHWIGGFSIFTWQPIDSYSRLITARRNPCLIVLTVSVLVNRPDLGLVAVAVWTLLSTAFLLVRLIMGWHLRRTQGSLQSWLSQLDRRPAESFLAKRWFAG
jgi:phosphatidylglycerophosphate synthase